MMIKAIAGVLVVIAIFGTTSLVVEARSYIPSRSYPYYLYSTTPPPPSSSSVPETSTSTPLNSQEDDSNSQAMNLPTRTGGRKLNIIVVSDPDTGDVFYIPADTFWARFGSASNIRNKRSSGNSGRTSRVLEILPQQPRLHLDEMRQIDDISDDENNDYNNDKYSDYLRSVSQYLSPYYEDNEALSEESMEYASADEVQVQANRKDAPSWKPSEVFQAFFPNYRYSPDKIVYTYSSVCANGCKNNKKYYANVPVAESISADEVPSTSVTPSSTSTTSKLTTTTTSTTTTEASSLEEQSTANTDVEVESTTTPLPTVVDYDDNLKKEAIEVAAA